MQGRVAAEIASAGRAYFVASSGRYGLKMSSMSSDHCSEMEKDVMLYDRAQSCDTARQQPPHGLGVTVPGCRRIAHGHLARLSGLTIALRLASSS